MKTNFQSPATQAIKASKPKAEGAAAKGNDVFSKLLASAATETKELTAEGQSDEILEEIEKILEILEGLSGKELASDSQEAVAAVVQLPLQTLNLVQETPSAEVVNQPKTIDLLQQVQQELQDLSGKQLAEIHMLLKFAEGEAEPEKLEQALKQLAQQLDKLEIVQAAEEKPGTAPLTQKLEQVLKQLVQLTQKLESPELATDPVKPNSSEAVTPKAEPVQAPLIEGAKTTLSLQAPPRAEAPVPAAVRMGNLAADLSSVLRGSMRLAGVGENMQLKMSIFPEHLGHLDIRLATADGKVAAHIFTSTLAAKEALDLQLNQLRNILLQQGVDLDRIEITQQSSQQSFGQHNANPGESFTQQQKQGTANKNGYQRIDEEAAAVKERSQAPGSSVMKVDYII